MDLKLQNKTVLVTGSAHGIGLGVVTTFLEEGARVVVTDIQETVLNQAVSTLVQQFGQERVLGFCGDLSKETVLKECTDTALRSFGSLDILVCNIGSGRSKMGLDATLDDWKAIFDINLFTTVAAVRICAPQMNTGGSIVFIASIAGIQALKAPYAYSAAKAGILSLVKNLSDDMADRAVRVNGVAPGNVLFPGSVWSKKMNEDRTRTTEYIEKSVPLKTFADPSDIGNAVAFLASEKARFITGTCLVVDGGQTRIV